MRFSYFISREEIIHICAVFSLFNVLDYFAMYNMLLLFCVYTKCCGGVYSLSGMEVNFLTEKTTDTSTD